MLEAEREQGLQEEPTLQDIVQQFREHGNVPRPQAILALERAAAMGTDARPFNDDIVALAEQALGFPFDGSKGARLTIRKGQVHHTYRLQRGLMLALRWDGKLLHIDVDKKEREIRRKALAFVGIGHETQTDVAEKHDEYLAQAIE